MSWYVKPWNWKRVHFPFHISMIHMVYKKVFSHLTFTLILCMTLSVTCSAIGTNIALYHTVCWRTITYIYIEATLLIVYSAQTSYYAMIHGITVIAKTYYCQSQFIKCNSTCDYRKKIPTKFSLPEFCPSSFIFILILSIAACVVSSLILLILSSLALTKTGCNSSSMSITAVL